MSNEYDKQQYSESELRRYGEDMDFVIGAENTEMSFNLPFSSPSEITDYHYGTGAYCDLDSGGGNGKFVASVTKRLTRLTSLEHRRVGIVMGWNEDGSPKVRLLGNDSFYFGLYNNCKWVEIIYSVKGNHDLVGEIKYPISPLVTYHPGDYSNPTNSTDGAIYTAYNTGMSLDDAFDYTPVWHDLEGSAVDAFLHNCCTYEFLSFTGYDEITLTNDPLHTLHLGYGKISDFFSAENEPTIRIGINRYEGMAGDLFNNLQNWTSYLANSAMTTLQYLKESEQYNVGLPVLPFDVALARSFAFRWIPYNLILTENPTEAQEYIRSGRLPSDAWIYPWNPDEFPTDSPVDPGGDDDDDDDGDPDDKTPDKDIDDMAPVTPQTTPQMLNANNLYWLQRGQLATFIDWFWLDAGTILDAGDLWDKVKGLYNDLASAVVNVRFMPVRPEWIGGVTPATNIIVGQIECPMANVATINRGVQTVQNIGSYQISEIHKNFVDYSPHAEITLYLPFHGYMSLDNDILEGDTLNVRAVYDVISGTIQYFIYLIKGNNKALINTCLAKMAVDIPITLQSKSDRDSAIFNNVMNATGSLMSAGVSLATKNPVGMMLSVGGAVAGGTQSAQLNVKGTVGESGSFFLPNRCAIFIKKTFYQLPQKYGFHVGYPCYKTLSLGDSRLRGSMVKIHNPYITFSGNKFSDGDTSVTNRPLEKEVAEIYELLEKGVIL